jgi:hypothetical protein
VTMAQAQLMMSLSPLVTAQIQLQAQAAFRASVKQLALTARIPKGEERQQAKTGTDDHRARNPVVQRRSGGDPRAFLMMVGGGAAKPQTPGESSVAEPEPSGGTTSEGDK